MTEATFHRRQGLEATAPTLIEGLPGTGLVASIVVEQITDQLDLSLHGAIRSEAFPSVASFSNGLVRDAVRVYGGSDPAILTLQSDIQIPEQACFGLGLCVLEDLVDRFGRAIFIAGAASHAEEHQGEITAVATTDGMKAELVEADIDLAEEHGLVGGVTGSLVRGCFHRDIPAALLLVRTDPQLPDPDSARVVVEEALEPLLGFDIDTEPLHEQAEQIQQQKQEVSQQLQQAEAGGDEPARSETMFH